jgi:hypothetical protein
MLGASRPFLDERANAVGVVGLVGQDNDARSKAVEQLVGDLSVVRLRGRQTDPDREPLGVDDDVDFRREAASASTETIIWTPFFTVAACWCARMEVLSISWICPSWAALTAPMSLSQRRPFASEQSGCSSGARAVAELKPRIRQSRPKAAHALFVENGRA